MTDERDHVSRPDRDSDNNVDNKLDSLLPVPDDREPHTPDQVDGPMDEVLRTPGKRDTSDDDASTREEMEVDTTADGVDDFIPLNEPETSSTDELEAPDTESNDDVSNQSSCLICGEEIGGARFCPQCGTEQVPASKAVARLAPLFMWSRPLAIRVTLSIGALLVLLALLSDSGTMALIFASAVIPVVILIRLADQLGEQNRSGWVQIAMMMLVGIAAGLPIAWLGTRIVRRSWVDGGIVNFGATTFGGTAIETAGSAPFLVWLVAGLLLPLIAILAIASAPAALRMALAMPPRESTGSLLSAGVGSGYAIGSAAVFYWPLFTESPPVMSTSQWTLTILGVALLRPLIWGFSGAMVGAVVWRYLRHASLPGVAVPAAMVLGILLISTLLLLATAPAGLWATTLVGLIFAAIAVWLHARFLDTAVRNDLNAESLATA